MEPGPAGRAAYYGKWDKFATAEERAIAEEEARLAEEAAKQLGLASGAPVSQQQADEAARRAALRDAKKQWDAHKDREFQAKAWIEGEAGAARDLHPAQLGGKEVIHLRGCTGGRYTLPADTVVAKLFVEACKECTFVLAGRVITGHVEAWNCDSVSFIVDSQLGTLQTDGCARVAVTYATAAHVGAWVHAASSALSVQFADGTAGAADLLAGVDGAADAAADVQFITRWVSGSLLTERVVRDAMEYPTTARELRAEGREEEAGEAAAARRAALRREQGNAAFKEGSWAQAVVFYTQSVAAAPSAAALSNRAAAFLKLGEHEKALADAEAAVALEPSHVKALFRKGLALHALARYGEAARVLDAACALEPTNAQLKDAVRMAEYMASKTARGAAAC